MQWQHGTESPSCVVGGTCCVDISDVDAGQAKEVRAHLQVHIGGSTVSVQRNTSSICDQSLG